MLSSGAPRSTPAGSGSKFTMARQFSMGMFTRGMNARRPKGLRWLLPVSRGSKTTLLSSPRARVGQWQRSGFKTRGGGYLTEEARNVPGVTDAYIAREREYQAREIERRKKLFRSVRPVAPLAGRSIILTDDGISTGSTMIAALEVIKSQAPHELIVAVPVAP